MILKLKEVFILNLMNKIFPNTKRLNIKILFYNFIFKKIIKKKFSFYHNYISKLHK